MLHRRRNRALRLAVLGLGFCGAAPGWAAVTKSGDTTVAASASQNTTVGNTGVGTLTIDGGSSLSNSSGELGVKAGSAGTVTVSGTGSGWINSNPLTVGFSGSGTLTISAGAQVSSKIGSIGSSAGSTGSVTVSGTGSSWTNSGTYGGSLIVGSSGSGALTIQDGGQVSNTTGRLGYHAGSSGTATVSGTGSTWASSSDLFVGDVGSGRLTVSDGGLVTAKTLYASPGDLYGDGTITASGGAVLDADMVFNASTGNTQALAFGTGGTLNVTVDGGALGVGYKGSGSLSIADGVVMTSSYGYLGHKAGSSGTANVSGAGSMWTTTSDLYVGNSGTGSLTIEGGGHVSNNYGYLGQYAGATGTAMVRGAGSKWTSKVLAVGLGGAGTLMVSDGAEVTTGSFYASPGDLHGDGTISVSRGAVLDADLVFDSAHGNTQTLAFGNGGTLNLAVNGGDLGVGYKGTGTLRIADGVQLASYTSQLGYDAGSSGTATVSGEGSAWTSSGWLFIGRSGSGTLAIEAGGQVASKSGHLGYYAGSTGTASVSGTNSIWTCGALTVGRDGNGTLNIEGGGQVSSSAGGSLGYNPGSTGMVTVSGAGSQWISGNIIYVGRLGSGTLTIEGGAQVSATSSYIANGVDSTGVVTVSGAGSTWANSGDLRVGNNGSGTLIIRTGGQVSSAIGRLGYNSLDAFASVSGVGSKWTNSSALYIGGFGRGTLTVEAGGQLSSSSGRLGQYTTGSSGTVMVSGADSKWTNSGDLDVVSGILAIEAGGQVSNSSGRLGSYSSGTATVRGAGSIWTNSGSLNLGDSGTGTLTVADGGKVTAKNLTIYNRSTVQVHVSGNDMLVLGDASAAGSLANIGTVSFYADALLPAGVYQPISEHAGRTMAFSGNGAYKAFGGIWSSSAKTFTVAEPTALLAGTSDTVTSGERLLFTDTATGRRVGASFGTVTGSASFSATPMDDAAQTALAGLLSPGEAVLSAWSFATDLGGSEVLFSFDAGRWVTDLAIWRLSSGTWSAYTSSLLTHDANGTASFTVSSFSGYAVAAVQLPQWQGDDAATPALWSTVGNWNTQAQPGKGGQAVFTQSAANKDVDLDGGTCTAGLVRLASSDGYSIHNGTLVIDNDGKAGGGIRLESGGNGGHTISAAVRIEDDAAITIEGGSLNLSGGVRIAGGKTLSVAKAAADSLSISAITGGAGTLSLAAGTVTKLNGNSSIGELEMEASARLDLSAAELVVAAGSLAEVNALVASGRSGGSWDGTGIVSSALAGEDANRTLAVLAEGDGVKVMQTWAGDLTGDGMVDGADYLVLDRNWLADPGTLLYAQGNIDYSLDGISGDDFFRMDRSYLGQSTALSIAGAPAGGEPGAATSAVPEPGGVVLLGVAVGALLARRRG